MESDKEPDTPAKARQKAAQWQKGQSVNPRGSKVGSTPHQIREAIRRRDHGDETLADIGRLV
jgi:hypothetical protein